MFYSAESLAYGIRAQYWGDFEKILYSETKAILFRKIRNFLLNIIVLCYDSTFNQYHTCSKKIDAVHETISWHSLRYYFSLGFSNIYF